MSALETYHMERDRKRYSEPITPGVAPDAEGIVCRRCGCGHFRVLYTRPATRGGIRRRRECRHCGTRVTTIERPSDDQQPADADRPDDMADPG